MIVKNEKGVTLIELLAAITLLMIVLIPFSTVFFQGFKANVENVEALNTKIVATGILEELKAGVSQSKESVQIGDEVYTISNPSNLSVTDQSILIDGKSYSISFKIEQYALPNSMLSDSITVIPTNLYKISLTIASVNGKANTLFVIVERL